VRRAVAVDRGAVVASLFDVAYLDSRMVHEIFTMAKRLAQNRQLLSMVWPKSKSARYILETAGVPIVVRFYDSIDDAARAASAP
jgi:hypothetical protein